MLRERSFAHRGGIACRMGEQDLTWEELHSRASALAAKLAEGSGPVLIYGEKSPAYVIAMVGCLWAGRPYVPAGPHYPAQRVSSMVAQTNIHTAICLQPLPTPLQDTVHCLSISLQGRECFALPAAAPDDIAYILFTSGSTGAPKGVVVTYANLENFIAWFTTRPAIAGLYPHAVLNQALFTFDLSVADLYYTLYTGCTLELSPEGSSLATCDSRAQLAVMTPSFVDCCLLDERFAAKALPCLQTIFFCGEPLRGSTVRRLWRRFPGLRIINAYGPTEATCAVTAVEITPKLAKEERLPIGYQHGEAVTVTLERQDRITLQAESVADDDSVSGEQNHSCSGCITLQGQSVAAGYLGGEKFHGRFVTGDIGYFENGYLWYASRCDDQIKYKGYRIEPGEIEAALTALPGIHQAVVLPRKDRLGRVISLQAVAAATGEPQEEQVRQALASMLPEYMVPRRILFWRALAMTVNGKIDRRKAAALLDQSNVPTDEKERNKCFT